MQTAETVTRPLMRLAAVAALALLCAAGTAGCAALESRAAKARVVRLIRAAYDEGGREAVCDRIVGLVADGTLSGEQASRLLEIAQDVYDRVLDRLEDEVERAEPEEVK